jgi:sec-independent protein translocase protein TatA
MFAFLDSPTEIGIVVLVIVLLFGGSQLPKLARSIGQAQKEFKKGLAEGGKDDEDTTDAPKSK